jgi:hypothetical protein
MKNPLTSPKSRKIAFFAFVAMVVVCLLMVAWFLMRSPFSRESVLKQLGEAGMGNVQISGFHHLYFPHLGCVLENVRFQHNPKPGTPPLIVIKELTIQGSVIGMFSGRVHVIRANEMRILIPPANTESFQSPQRSTVVIDNIIADGATLEIVSRQADVAPLKFVFQTFSLSHVGGSGPASFRARISNPEPPGEIITAGKFGPWDQKNVGDTPVSGEFSFQHADLSAFHGIAGLLSSSAQFSGKVNHIEVRGSTDTPHFTVTSSSHKVDLRTQFQGLVNAQNGDTSLDNLLATFWKTTIWSKGSIASASGQTGKVTSFEFASKDGRIQDLLRLFSQARQAPMSGEVSFHGKASIPSENRSFLRKVILKGDFGIDAGKFTKADTQESVNHLSQGALGEEVPKSDDPGESQAPVLSGLKGHVELKDGVARFFSLSFSVPGALASLHGTYNLLTERIDLHGTLKTISQPSNTTHGVKALILKVLDPFFKKKRAGYTMPIKITGTYDNPSFGMDLADHDSKNPPRKDANSSQSSKASQH